MTEIPVSNEGKPQKEVPALSGEFRDKTKLEMSRLLNTPRWRVLIGDEIEREKDELRRTAEELELDYSNLEQAFDIAKLEQLSDEDWSIMTNTDSGGEWTKDDVIAHIGDNRDHCKIFNGLENGNELPAPVVLFRKNEPPYLIGGNTRLMACKALDFCPHVLAVRI